MNYFILIVDLDFSCEGWKDQMEELGFRRGGSLMNIMGYMVTVLLGGGVAVNSCGSFVIDYLKQLR